MRPLANRDALVQQVKAIMQPAYEGGEISKVDFKRVASAATKTARQMAVAGGLPQPGPELTRVLGCSKGLACAW